MHSPERLLDLTALFPHRTVGQLPDDKRQMLLDLHESDQVLAGKKVLIVDDDMRNIFALSTVLEEHDMEIVSADNGRDAIRILQTEPDIDIVLMDIMMPEMDGMETMREIRKIPQPEGPADRRRDRQGHEGRPREVHRGRGLGLPVQAGGHRADAGRAAGVAAPVDDRNCDSSRRACRCMDRQPTKTNILIVDDLPEKLLVYQAILEELGQDLVVTAHSGEEALKQVLQHDFAVILLDVNMPGMDGFETAALIRKRKRSAHTPIIFVTAFADEVRMARGLRPRGGRLHSRRRSCRRSCGPRSRCSSICSA